MVDVIVGLRAKGILCGLPDVLQLGKIVDRDEREDGPGRAGGWIETNRTLESVTVKFVNCDVDCEICVSICYRFYVKCFILYVLGPIRI